MNLGHLHNQALAICFRRIIALLEKVLMSLELYPPNISLFTKSLKTGRGHHFANIRLWASPSHTHSSSLIMSIFHLGSLRSPFQTNSFRITITGHSPEHIPLSYSNRWKFTLGHFLFKSSLFNFWIIVSFFFFVFFPIMFSPLTTSRALWRLSERKK